MTLNELKEMVDEKVKQGYGQHELFSRGPRYSAKSEILLTPYYSVYHDEEVLLLTRMR